MNTDHRKNAKNDFEKDFFKLMNNSVFGRTMENIRNHRDIKTVATDKQRNKLASEPNYHTTKYISENLLIMEMKKKEVVMNKPIYLGQAILDISKTLLYEFWYDYLKPKSKDKVKLCYMDTYSFKWFDTSNYDKNDNRPLALGKNKNVIGMFKDELGGKIMTKFWPARVKIYSYLIDDYDDDDYDKNKIINKKAKGTKKCVIKRTLKFKDYYDSVFKNKTIIRSQPGFKSDHYIVHTEEANKSAISSNDDKRIQIFDKVPTYPYGTSVFKACAV